MFDSPLEALIACRNQWSLLYITGNMYKNIYIPSIDWDSDCACCEYSKTYWRIHDTRYVCAQCPLMGYAWNLGCVSDKKSLYNLWLYANNESARSYYAYRIVQACNRAIEDILIGE